MQVTCRLRRRHVLTSLLTAAVLALPAGVTPAQTTDPPAKPEAGSLDGPWWDDGLAEMCYYRATDTIYKVKRTYTRVHVTNRQWMDAATGVKTEADAPGAVPVFKLVVAEEVPTENYNHRYLSVVFLKREDLSPFKATFSSQDWSGSTFKHLRWGQDKLVIQSFSYFGGEGDKTWLRDLEYAPYESLFVLAREVAASGQTRRLAQLPPMRSTHEVRPIPDRVLLSPEGPVRQIKVPAGSFQAQRVTVQGRRYGGWFDVEAAPPWRLLAFSAAGVTGRLKHVERRSYWDPSSKSGFYEQNQAP